MQYRILSRVLVDLNMFLISTVAFSVDQRQIPIGANPSCPSYQRITPLWLSYATWCPNDFNPATAQANLILRLTTLYMFHLGIKITLVFLPPIMHVVNTSVQLANCDLHTRLCNQYIH